MKFGVLQFFSWPGRRVPLPVVYERALERIQVMDRSGYDAVWLAEHHFNDFSVCPSVHVMAAHVAARTRNLRIGTGVTLAALAFSQKNCSKMGPEWAKNADFSELDNQANS